MNLGVIEAILRLKDEFSAGVRKAQTDFATMKAHIAAAGTATSATAAAASLASAAVSGLRAAFMGLVAIAGPLIALVAGLSFLKMAGDVVTLSGKLTDLSSKTGIGTTELQKLKFMAEQSGGSLDSVSRAVTVMGRNLIEGNKSAVEGVKRLGLNLHELRQMQPDQAFAQIADKIALIPSPMEKAAIATQIFGKTGAELLPMFTGNLKEMGKAAADSGLILSEATVAAGDEFGDALGKLMTVGMALIGNVLGPFLPLLTRLIEWASMLANVIGTLLVASLNGLMSIGRSVIQWFANMVSKFFEFAKSIPGVSSAVSAASSALDGLKSAAQFVGEKYQELKPKTDAATGGLQNMKLTVGPLADDTKKLAKETKELAKAAGELAERQRAVDLKNHTQQLLTFANAMSPLRTLLLANRQELMLLLPLERDWATVNTQTTQTLQDMVAKGQVFKDTIGPKIFDGMRDSADRTRVSILSLSDAVKSVFANIGPSVVAGLSFALENALTGAQSLGSSLKQLGTHVAKDFVAGMLSFIPGVGPILAQFAGPLVEGVKKLFGGLFGPTDYEKRVRAAAEETKRLQAEALSLYGGMDRLRVIAQSVGIQIDEAFRWQDPVALKKILDELATKHAAVGAAAKKAADDAKTQQQAAIDTVKARLGELDAEYNQLFESIRDEAPEEVMGVVEQQTRARMEAIEKERKATQTELEKLTEAMATSFEGVTTAVETLIDAIERIPTSIPGGHGNTGISTPAVPSSSGTSAVTAGFVSAGARAVTIRVPLVVDGRVLAEVVAREALG